LKAFAGHASSEQSGADLSGEALAALGATCVEHSAATAGCHACAETMSALAANDGRLISTFHYGSR
jgi:hypothetical protein